MIPLGEVAAYAEQIVEAVAHIQGCKILHKGLVPDHVLVCAHIHNAAVIGKDPMLALQDTVILGRHSMHPILSIVDVFYQSPVLIISDDEV